MQKRHILSRSLWWIAVFLFGCNIVSECKATEPSRSSKVKVFVLAGQSNMEGHAVVDLSGPDYNQGKGTLASWLQHPDSQKLFSHLKDEGGEWATRNDVWIRYQRENQPLLAGPLGIGFTVYGDKHHFGPELQFGHVLGERMDKPVLLIKTAWGGKSLYQDFRPPSSGGSVGPYYQKMVAEVRQGLQELASGQLGFQDVVGELAGFVWYQGWNDGVDPKSAIPEYEQNLVHLIQDFRMEFDVPQLPVVVGELTGPWVDAPADWIKLRQAQAAACRHPELGNNVRFVETRNFVRKAEESPNPGHGHHEFGNAETIILVGNAIGQAMLDLISVKQESIAGPGKSRVDPTQPASRSSITLHGWTVLMDDRLQASPHGDVGTQAMKFLEGKLADIVAVVPKHRVEQLQRVKIVMDLQCGQLKSMQYHPSAQWLKENGYSTELEKCVHIPVALDLPTRRNINEQPWVILHELAHAFHDQYLGFENEEVMRAFVRFQQGGRGESTLLFNGQKVKHYALTNQMEFFAEMTEALFGVNDFYPFNQAELRESEPETLALLKKIWESEE